MTPCHADTGSWLVMIVTLHSQFIVLLEQDGADEADDGVIIGEDADDLGPAFDFAIEALDRVVTGIRSAVLMFGCDFVDRGVWCDHPGQRHREHEGAGRPMHPMSCELVLVAGRLCDSPGCAESADP
ncbi:hypothetical protein FB004_1297 [Sinorhizobium medicae]|nr:hypothetical protein FB004_1297 [Sinorhizobium medicae]TWA24437.1 hypothetical protein FB007_14220 [Sinorhizobium medicae]TWA31550.1 hypothetical protein FB009_13525 [Sinorhizobium medicae]TWA34702.1 hypothetical protein FB005_1387 [Sinorhizobium medicae]